MEEWSNQGSKISTLPLTQGDARAFSRLFFSGAAECEMDKQGRVLVPSNLREYAKIDREVVKSASLPDLKSGHRKFGTSTRRGQRNLMKA